MINFRNVAAASLVALALVGGLTANAQAGGFLADIIRPLNPDAADAADDLNAALGNPVDHAIAQGANIVVPGLGDGMEAWWALRRSGALSRPGAIPAPQGMPSPMYGNFCSTSFGVAGPGPARPVGSPCVANGWAGPQPGVIVR